MFGQDGTKQAFLGCLGEAAQKGNWVVHAWGVMSSHYHACIETLEPNLVSGMRWLQATFSLRFNRFRAEHGHVFLKALGKTADDLRSDKKSAPWKIALAAEMKSRTTASNPWLANQLNMGSPFRLSRLASACRTNPQEFALYNRRMAKCKV